tara:strand:+ start:421 stop:1701 length:1281 start_codon:yes stop_codon:yes gene_type:complete
MAQTDLTSLLTGVSSAPINPMQGLDREGRMAQRAQGFSDRMTRGMLQAGGQDPRTLGQQAQAALAQLDINNPDDQPKIMEIVSRVNPERAAVLKAQFAQQGRVSDTEKAEVTRKTNIRNSVIARIKDDPRYTNILPLIEQGVYDDNPEELISLLKQEPVKGASITKPFAGQDANGNPLMLTVQSVEGQDDQVVEVGSRKPPPSGTILSRVDGTKVEVNLNDDTVSAFETELGKGLAEDLIKSRNTATGSLLTADTLNSQWDLVDGNLGIIAGTGTDLKLGVGKALSALGLLSGEGEDLIANTEAFLANAGNLVAEVITKFGAGTGLSDKDLEFAKKMAAADSSVLTEEGIRRILRLQARAIQRKVEIHNKKVANSPAKDSVYDMTVKIPEFSWAALQPDEDGYTAASELPPEVNDLLTKYGTGKKE